MAFLIPLFFVQCLLYFVQRLYNPVLSLLFEVVLRRGKILGGRRSAGEYTRRKRCNRGGWGVGGASGTPVPKSERGSFQGVFSKQAIPLIPVAGYAVLVPIQIGALSALGGSPASGNAGGAVLGAGARDHFKGMITTSQGAGLKLVSCSTAVQPSLRISCDRVIAPFSS